MLFLNYKSNCMLPSWVGWSDICLKQDHSNHVWSNLALWFQNRTLKCEKLTKMDTLQWLLLMAKDPILQVLQFPPTIKVTPPPWYNWNIVESGIKHHNHKPILIAVDEFILHLLKTYLTWSFELWHHTEKIIN